MNSKLIISTPADRYAIGTRAVIRRDFEDYRVVCATCEGGGSNCYASRSDALRVAVAHSNRKCRLCGAE